MSYIKKMATAFKKNKLAGLFAVLSLLTQIVIAVTFAIGKFPLLYKFLISFNLPDITVNLLSVLMGVVISSLMLPVYLAIVLTSDIITVFLLNAAPEDSYNCDSRVFTVTTLLGWMASTWVALYMLYGTVALL